MGEDQAGGELGAVLEDSGDFGGGECNEFVDKCHVL